MKHIHSAITLPLTVLFAVLFANPVQAGEPVTLIGSIVPWRYPEAKILHPEMSDAATMDAEGNRTIPSTLLKTNMVTPDPVDKVLAFYRGKLKRNKESNTQLGVKPAIGQSVIFNDESSGRAFTFHSILVNAPDTSTTILITRAPSEEFTYITWKRYVKHPVQH